MTSIWLYIDWNVNPEIVNLGGFSLRWYSLLFAAGFVIGYFIVKRMFKRENVPLEWLDSLLMYMVIGTVIGARLGHCLFYDWDYYSQHPLQIILPFRFQPEFEFTGYQGLASHGGAVGNIIALWLFSKYVSKRSLLWILDRVVVPVALAGAFIRLGNLMNSEILGEQTTVSWAFIFHRVDDIPRHPVQLYEALSYLIIFIVLYLAYWQTEVRKKRGLLFGWFLTLIFGARFIIEYTKEVHGDLEAALGDVFTTGQWLSIPFILVGVYFILKARKPSAER